MELEMTSRVANSIAALERILDEIEQGDAPKPDWIRLQARCRLDKLSTAQRERMVQRLHRCVLRGFRASNVQLRSKSALLDYWSTIARNGFHDFSEQGWMKCYDSPFVENYDYVTPYKRKGLAGLDDYLLYTSVLGTLDYTVEDFVNTLLCEKVETIVEPMAGTAEFAHFGHFRHPEFRYVMFDLDEKAQAHVASRDWLAETQREYFIGNVLDESSWKRVRELSVGQSLSYIGKQSHHFFNVKQLLKLIEYGTRYVDYFMLEVPEPTLMNEISEEEDLTRPEMKAAGFELSLLNLPDTEPNPLTNKLSFELVVNDADEQRVLFEYHDWTNWQHPMLVALASLLDLNVFYFHSDDSEFVTVDEKVEDSDCLDNVTFMMFSRHDHPVGAR
jgi:hypothetical protein